MRDRYEPVAKLDPGSMGGWLALRGRLLFAFDPLVG